MSQPDHESIVEEIRSARIAASPELRARVRAIAASAPEAAPARERRSLPWRRLALVVVPAAVAVALAVSLVAGLRDSGSSGSRDAVHGEVAASPKRSAGTADTFAAPSAKSAGTGGATGLPATPGRAQLYEAELTLKIADLSAATKRALRLTHDLNGYVRSVEYGSGSERGSASLVVRIPVGSVQAALVKYSALGEILDQHVSIRDVQPQVDRRFRQLQAQRDVIAKLQAQLESPSLTSAERAQLEARLVAARRQLVVLAEAAGGAAAPDLVRDRVARPADQGQGGRRPARARPHRPRLAPLARDRRRRGKGAGLRADRRCAVLRARRGRARRAERPAPASRGAAARYFLTVRVVTLPSCTENRGLTSLIRTGLDQVICFTGPGTYGSIPRTR